jgi:hypothetical protein
MEYLQNQLRVSASTLAIIRLAFNLSGDYTFGWGWLGGGVGATRLRFTLVGSMNIITFDRISDI